MSHAYTRVCRYANARKLVRTHLCVRIARIWTIWNCHNRLIPDESLVIDEECACQKVSYCAKKYTHKKCLVLCYVSMHVSIHLPMSKHAHRDSFLNRVSQHECKHTSNQMSLYAERADPGTGRRPGRGEGDLLVGPFVISTLCAGVKNTARKTKMSNMSDAHVPRLLAWLQICTFL